MKITILLILSLVTANLCAQIPTKLSLRYDTVEHIKNGRSVKSYFNSGDIFFNTNQTKFQFNKPIQALSFVTATDTSATKAEIRSNVSTASTGLTKVANDFRLGGQIIGDTSIIALKANSMLAIGDSAFNYGLKIENDGTNQTFSLTAQKTGSSDYSSISASTGVLNLTNEQGVKTVSLSLDTTANLSYGSNVDTTKHTDYTVPTFSQMIREIRAKGGSGGTITSDSLNLGSNVLWFDRANRTYKPYQSIDTYDPYPPNVFRGGLYYDGNGFLRIDTSIYITSTEYNALMLYSKNSQGLSVSTKNNIDIAMFTSISGTPGAPGSLSIRHNGSILQSFSGIEKFSTDSAGNIFATGQLKSAQLSGALTDDTPTASEINAIIGTASAKGAGFQATIKDNNGTGLLYKVESDGTDWFYEVLTKAL